MFFKYAKFACLARRFSVHFCSILFGQKAMSFQGHVLSHIHGKFLWFDRGVTDRPYNNVSIFFLFFFYAKTIGEMIASSVKNLQISLNYLMKRNLLNPGAKDEALNFRRLLITLYY